ncbi:hypothetical protein OA58_17135 [Microcystis aeruginosa NIES-88]|nr:hypothetical protein OA58_17135 [Microcystis aeruginosa NIES-88]BCU11499.1 hypothetical protein MAN88_20630 [Microcystis aeruginosa]
MLTDWKKQEELDFLNEVSCVPLQQGLRHLRLFGLCYAMDGGYKGWNPYIERHLAIFVNCF